MESRTRPEGHERDGTRIARANPRSPDRGAVIYTVKWSDHISGESKHLEDALKAVIRKL